MNILILGGGISGLSAAWFLRKRYPQARITLLEKTGRLGGWIQTDCVDGSIVERGPRTFMRQRSPGLLELIEEIGLKEDLIISDPKAAVRYVWNRGKLRSLGSLFLSCAPALFKECFVRTKTPFEDESIYQFACRRFSTKTANLLFDPMTLGIYGGDIHQLSIRACFPFLVRLEEDKGSLVRGMLSRKKNKTESGLFTLKHGMERLIERLYEKSAIEFVPHSEVVSIQDHKVKTQGKVWEADLILSALPGSVICQLVGFDPVFEEISLDVAQFGYDQSVLKQSGYGYLVPSLEQEPLLGAIWDTSVFPHQNASNKTFLTCMLRLGGGVQEAQDALKRHLGIDQPPIYTSYRTALHAIPQFKVGYLSRLALFQAKVKEKVPSLKLIGNYLEGPSVESCIQYSKKMCFQ